MHDTEHAGDEQGDAKDTGEIELDRLAREHDDTDDKEECRHDIDPDAKHTAENLDPAFAKFAGASREGEVGEDAEGDIDNRPDVTSDSVVHLEFQMVSATQSE